MVLVRASRRQYPPGPHDDESAQGEHRYAGVLPASVSGGSALHRPVVGTHCMVVPAPAERAAQVYPVGQVVVQAAPQNMLPSRLS